MRVRRVMTGRTPDGKSVYVSDESVDGVLPPLLGGNEVVRLYGSDAPVEIPTDGSMPPHRSFFPGGPGGLRFILWRMVPRGQEPPAPQDMEEARRVTDEMVPDMFTTIEDRESDHATDTIDLLYCVSGKCDLELDEGEHRTIETGDFLVQANTNHSWSNPYDEDCLLVLVMYGAAR